MSLFSAMPALSIQRNVHALILMMTVTFLLALVRVLRTVILSVGYLQEQRRGKYAFADLARRGKMCIQAYQSLALNTRACAHCLRVALLLVSAFMVSALQHSQPGGFSGP
ncbi:hypothetical protein DUNSADRAFT_4263 [Dunaliella salina]|uniref:Encoded protein n=1 Tax=Dunaliella salina TaxID=3046 RepID=A0ABQ7GSD0_DUNSA|nr:hypothetical protein DUNSADRAFT_4263 [Dunaliella salina]|eukprot:KAF5837516.1 hypothetical protein DUNSADRAFT_4263 [Dunaliella salina]